MVSDGFGLIETRVAILVRLAFLRKYFAQLTTFLFIGNELLCRRLLVTIDRVDVFSFEKLRLQFRVVLSWLAFQKYLYEGAITYSLFIWLSRFSLTFNASSLQPHLPRSVCPMNVKKYFCCVPIINVRQSVTVSHDKGVQHNSIDAAPSTEVYKNVAFIEDEKRGSLDSRRPSAQSIGARRASGFSEDSKDSQGKLKEVCFRDIRINNLHGSQSSLNSGTGSNGGSFSKVREC